VSPGSPLRSCPPGSFPRRSPSGDFQASGRAPRTPSGDHGVHSETMGAVRPPSRGTTVCSLGSAPLGRRQEHLDCVIIDGLANRYDGRPRPVATPDGRRTHHTGSGSWLRSSRGPGRVSLVLAGPLCPARSRSPDLPTVVHRLGNPLVLAVRVIDSAARFPRVDLPYLACQARKSCRGTSKRQRKWHGRRSARPAVTSVSDPEIHERSHLRTRGNGHFSHVVSARESKGMGGRRRWRILRRRQVAQRRPWSPGVSSPKGTTGAPNQYGASGAARTLRSPLQRDERPLPRW